MIINVQLETGKIFQLDVRPSETISSVLKRCKMRLGVSTGVYDIIYSGKVLLQHRKTLSDYHIGNRATISVAPRQRQEDQNTDSDLDEHLIKPRDFLQNSGAHTQPGQKDMGSGQKGHVIETDGPDFLQELEVLTSPTQQDTDSTTEEYLQIRSAYQELENLKTAEHSAGYYRDEHLINPSIYYRRLDLAEKWVIESSEFYRVKGHYQPTAAHFDPRRIPFPSLHLSTEKGQWLANIGQLFEPLGRTVTRKESILLSLGKSLLTLSLICDSIDLISKKGFCERSFTMLIQRDTLNRDIAELVEMRLLELRLFLSSIERTIRWIDHERVVAEDVSLAFTKFLLPACEKIMSRLTNSPRNLPETLQVPLLCRTLVDMLDLGLVSYIGCHGSRFDLDYIGEDLSSSLVERTTNPGIGFACSFRRLECLDEFLSRQPVWVFRPYWENNELEVANNPLAVLTTIEAFANTWGPIWKVSAGYEHPGFFKQLNVSTGMICRIQTKSDPVVEDAVSCHWFKPSSIGPYSPGVQGFIPMSAKLLIGLNHPTLRLNDSCLYKLRDFENDYGLQMIPLDTEASSWALQERQFGFSVSQYAGINVAGTQKKLPRTTLKQAIWNKWKNQPARANPQTLNSLLAVEISHCTGNARRMRLIDLFGLEPIQFLLNRQFPKWTSAGFGPALNKAFHSEDPTSIIDVWTYYYRSRNRISELVCYVLELLEKTGTNGGTFKAAFLDRHRELSMPIKTQLNCWSELLADSHLTAVYAIINERCLDGSELGNSVATCQSSSTASSAYTVLETQISIPQECIAEDKIRLNQGGYLQKIDPPKNGLQLVTWEPGRVHELGGRLGRLFGSKDCELLSREVQDKGELGGQHIPVAVKATVASYGGMSEKRTTNSPLQVDLGCFPASLPIRSVRDSQGNVEIVSEVQVSWSSAM